MHNQSRASSRSDALVLFTLAKQRAQKESERGRGGGVGVWLNWPLYAGPADHSIYQARRWQRLVSSRPAPPRPTSLWLSTLCKQNALKSPGPHSMCSSQFGMGRGMKQKPKKKRKERERKTYMGKQGETAAKQI